MIRLLWLYVLSLSLYSCNNAGKQTEKTFTGIFIKEQKISGNQSRLFLKAEDGSVKMFIADRQLMEPLTNFIAASGIKKLSVQYAEYAVYGSGETEKRVQTIMPVYEITQ